MNPRPFAASSSSTSSSSPFELRATRRALGVPFSSQSYTFSSVSFYFFLVFFFFSLVLLLSLLVLFLLLSRPLFGPRRRSFSDFLPKSSICQAVATQVAGELNRRRRVTPRR